MLHPVQEIEFDSRLIYIQPDDQDENVEEYPYFISPTELELEELDDKKADDAEKEEDSESDSEDEEPVEELLLGTAWEDIKLANLPWTVDISEEGEVLINDADRIRVEVAMELPMKRAGEDAEREETEKRKPREIRDAITVIGYRKARAKGEGDREKWRFTIGCFSSDVQRGHLNVLEPDFLVTQIGKRNVLNFSRKQAFDAIVRETLSKRADAPGVCEITYVPTTFRRTCEFQEMMHGEWKTGLVCSTK
eukprot:TRINITY_DN3171_c0_g1_i1.p1 TRINITY_DN3171_c0_g1~~TRINITY_DN3171_c0_g1_i1.p1  ORF type:complete len:250 (-),score=51.38 TRINITY_DN3171_c0_g1_i1:198-947(-)